MRRILGPIAIALLIAAAAALFFFREEIFFAWQIFQVNRAGNSYYANAETLTRDVVYSEDFATRLDVHRPASGDNHAVLIFVHGGGWNEYDKQFFTPVGMILSRRGIVAVIPDYTLYQGNGVREGEAAPVDDPGYGVYDLQARETAAAIAWTLDNIQEYGGDPAQVVVSGHSAGAHLAALALFAPQYLADLGHEPTEVCAFLGLSGVYDIAAQKQFNNAKGEDIPIMRAVMGGEENFTEASPTTYVRENLPPVTLIHGERDDVVPASISELLHGELRAAGAPSELVIYPWANHQDFLLQALTDDNAPILQNIHRVIDGCS